MADDHASAGVTSPALDASAGTLPNLNPRRWQALVVLLVGPFISLFDQFCVNLAAPSIDRSFILSPFQFQAVVGGYGLVFGLGLITGGRLGDNYGRRRMYQAGLLMFAATSLLCGVAWSPAAMIVARFAQGASAALLVPQVLALIRVQFPDSERPKALSWFSVAISAGMACGQLLGGAIPGWNIAGLGWRPVFFVSVVICLLTFFASGVVARDTEPGGGPRLDPAGVALCAGGIALLLIPLAAYREVRFVPVGLLVLVAGILVTALLAWHQVWRTRKAEATLLPVRLFRVPAFVLGVVLNFALYVASVPFFVLLGLYLQDQQLLSPAMAGLTFTPVAVGIAAGSRLGLPISQRFGPGTLIGAAVATTAGLGGVLVVLATMSGRGALLPLIVSITVFGFGNGTSVPLVAGIVLSQIPPKDAGAGSGVLTSAQQVAAAAGIAITGAFLYGTGTSANLHYPTAMVVEVVFAALAAATALALVRVVARAA